LSADTGPDSRRIGVVIPTLDEEERLPSLLSDLAALPFDVDVVVSDGGSGDRTVEAALAAGARVVEGGPGRARQMNAGAGVLRTPWILFLHADSHIPLRTRRALASWLDDPPATAAHFRFRLDARGPTWSAIEWGQRLREWLTGLAYGDQGLLLSRERWEGLGGFADIPLMEDVEIMMRLRRSGGVETIDAPIVTSARRYREEGRMSLVIRNGVLAFLYLLGASPASLARWRRPRRSLRVQGARATAPR
jgi:rSAM/selenodomain-associated transferase 2